MGDAAEMIPSISLTNEVLSLDRQSEEWKAMTGKVREACEAYGCFMLDYEKIPLELQQILFKTTAEMFDLPVETKLQYKKSTAKDGGYVLSNPFIPLYESFGVYGEEEVRAFEKLMWPQGNPQFCCGTGYFSPFVQKRQNSEAVRLSKKGQIARLSSWMPTHSRQTNLYCFFGT